MEHQSRVCLSFLFGYLTKAADQVLPDGRYYLTRSEIEFLRNKIRIAEPTVEEYEKERREDNGDDKLAKAE